MRTFKNGQRVRVDTMTYHRGVAQQTYLYGTVVGGSYNEEYVGEEEIVRVKMDRCGQTIAPLASFCEAV